MLDSTHRRDRFDAFFASLEPSFRSVFLDESHAQWETAFLQEGRQCSLIDCMENVMDYWLELRHTNPSHFGPLDHNRAVMAHMLDPDREERERNYRQLPTT